jgi:hypothetical protein
MLTEGAKWREVLRASELMRTPFFWDRRPHHSIMCSLHFDSSPTSTFLKMAVLFSFETLRTMYAASSPRTTEVHLSHAGVTTWRHARRVPCTVNRYYLLVASSSSRQAEYCQSDMPCADRKWKQKFLPAFDRFFICEPRRELSFL